MPTATMTAAQRKTFGQLLRTEREELDQQILALSGELQEVLDSRGEASADDEHDPEGPTMTAEWSTLSGVHGDVLAHRDAVDRAIARIDAGTYGTCLRCGQQISRERLRARPSADLCIDCARATEPHRY
ncbi:MULTISPECIES: TraR/DksA C4-type zinc finger protein [unclassified Salinibacterium]|uniref:TraR/DksA family transcriptional regulator n=1 Tax=unclassified Salinibacterium TaxID=2632331 RepID=UPI00141F41FA|nr:MULTISPECIES: TraR/DksA C4-type zinc finger protein [unclassified Salinibacterium]